MSASPAAALVARALRGSAPGLTRAVMTTLLDPQRRRAVAEAMARFDERRPGSILSAAMPRHPMAPAAMRVERTRSRTRRGRESEQLAVTMWFGEGPALPVPGGGRFGRGAARVGVGVASAAALAAASTLVARLGERPAAPRLEAAAARRRLEGPAEPAA